MSELSGLPLHDLATVYPSMSEMEYAALKLSILEDGQLEPIYAFDGFVVDGRHRQQVCLELGIEPIYQEIDGKVNLKRFVASKNAIRRNLSKTQAAVAAAVLSSGSVEGSSVGHTRNSVGAVTMMTAPTQDSGEDGSYTMEEAGKQHGVSRRVVMEARKILASAYEDLIQEARAGETSIRELMVRFNAYEKSREDARQSEERAKKAEERAKVLEHERDWEEALGMHKTWLRNKRDEEAAARREERMARARADGVTLHCLPVAQLSKEVEAESLGLILTDPPYEVKSLSVWRDLSVFADHALAPGGLLVAMSGQYALPDVMDSLGENLDYQWVICYLQERARFAVHQRRLNSAWKPVLVYAKGKYAGEYYTDLVRPELAAEHQNEHHEWEQDVEGMYNLLKQFAAPGDLVCDPFIGSGTTALSARKLGCSIIGGDIEQKNINMTLQRLEEAE